MNQQISNQISQQPSTQMQDLHQQKDYNLLKLISLLINVPLLINALATDLENKKSLVNLPFDLLNCWCEEDDLENLHPDYRTQFSDLKYMHKIILE